MKSVKTSNTSSTRKKKSSVASSGKTVLETEKKFFRMRGRGQVNDDKKPTVKNAAKTASKVTSKQKNIKATKRKLNTPDKPLTLRQMSLTESFAAQTVAKRLRPRKNTKNYLEESLLIEKYLSPQRRNSIVVVEKMEPPVARKAPVYKSMRVTDEHLKNGDEIYDFKFDINDSTERRNIKKKKRIRKPAVKRAKKTVTSNGKSSKVKTNVNSEQVARVPEVISNVNANELEEDINSPLKNNVENVKPTDILESEQESVAVHNARTQKEKVPLKTTLTDNASNVIKKPKVLSVQKLESSNKIQIHNIQGNPKATGTEQFKPFRPTNAFRSMYTVQKEMVNHSLLNKSLSPINKSLIDFDPSSPWRPPTFNTFSQVKQIFQSTPQPKKQSGVCTLPAVNPIKKTTTQGTKISEITKKNSENINLNIEKLALSKQNPLKENSPSKSPRVFGTDITSKITMTQPTANVLGVSNKNSNAQSRSNVSLESNKNAEVQSPAARVSNSSTKLSSVNNIPDFDDYTEDKENSIPNFQSLKKSPKKLSKRLNFPSPKRSLQQTQEIKATPGPSGLQKENLEPQPGPSGLQRRRLFDEPKKLQQSKLNNFLNLDTMPESTRISTTHGIFDDAQSTPINGKPKKTYKEPDIKNAFGFEDSDSELETSSIANKENDVPPMKQPVSNESIRKVDDLLRHKIKSIAKPARVSLGEVKKVLHPNVLKEKQNIMNAEKGDGKITNYLKKSELQDKETVKNKQSFDVNSFSDTFDMMSDNEYQTDKEQTTDPPLFADLEPSHFVEPPRYSYKRKRAAKYNFSDDEETENLDESFEKKQVKKKKVQKMNKKEEERLQQWVKNVNETFEEIDHYDLVVE
ncbi:muscle M-line assembly protein unc-89 [Cephus cinctus]|uniref:Muscle M-line assembly protein unc-89 n=1 Tax=Cephus cinctus TaxID=211228 RepID=A0AAJ7BGC1_CEPCN|nr:muscle M-line assembly protein unc-89 [Cephus cinctus]XP_015585400.1 muscle M-line assembly protein unc-89 [Cephus cinctus]